MNAERCKRHYGKSVSVRRACAHGHCMGAYRPRYVPMETRLAVSPRVRCERPCSLLRRAERGPCSLEHGLGRACNTAQLLGGGHVCGRLPVVPATH
ncbi:hypothetical protein MTO96_001454 [Rhipicephalus appendiculatus]